VDEEDVLEVEEDRVDHFASFRRVASWAAVARWTAPVTLARRALRMGSMMSHSPSVRISSGEKLWPAGARVLRARAELQAAIAEVGPRSSR